MACGCAGAQHGLRASIKPCPSPRRIELAPFSLPPPLGLLARMGMRVMPSASQLEKAGRPDLVAAVRQAGGFLEVAQARGGLPASSS